MLEDIAEIIGSLFEVAFREQAVADERKDRRVELFGLKVLGDLGEVFGGLLRLAGENGQLAEREEAAGLGDQGGAVFLEAEELSEFLLGLGAGVGTRFGLRSGLHALDFAGELLGEEDNELLGALLGAVVDRLSDGVGKNLKCTLLLVGDGDLTLSLDLGQFGFEFGGELPDGCLGDVNLGLGDALFTLECVDGLTSLGELVAEFLADLLGFGGELRHVAHALGGADDLIEIGHRLWVVVIPVEDFLEEVAHALVLAASREEFTKLAEGEFQGLRISAGALGGGLVAVDGLVRHDFLLLLDLGAEFDEFGLIWALGVDTDFEVGGLDALVDFVGEADVGVGD